MGRRGRSLEERQKEMKARHGKAAEGPGRPPLAVDPEIVLTLASQGCKLVEIAAYVGCDSKTLHDRLGRELNLGEALFTGSVKLAFYDSANRGDVRALIQQVKLRSAAWQEYLKPQRPPRPEKPVKKPPRPPRWRPPKPAAATDASQEPQREITVQQPWIIVPFEL